MGYTPKGLFSLFLIDGTKLIDGSFSDVANCFFSHGNKFAVVTHGSGKETKVTIYRIATKEVGLSVIQSHTVDIGFMKSGKRYVVFQDNDKVVAVQTAPHIIQVFDLKNGFEPKGKMEIVPSTDLGGLYCSPLPLLWANNPNTTKDNQKGLLFEIYNLNTMTVHHSSFFAGLQQIDLFPAPNTNFILVRGHKYVDTSGQSYYGKNTLDLLDLETHKKKKITTYNGPIYNLEWNPKGDSFVVCGGLLPSHTVVYDLKGEPLIVVAKDHKNSVFWSPNGEFIAVAGFGNLNGEIQIWNLPKKSLLGKCQHGDAGDLEWAPDGRHFLTKVEFGFLREGNTYRVISN
jgi:WD40 repeat protein